MYKGILATVDKEFSDEWNIPVYAVKIEEEIIEVKKPIKKIRSIEEPFEVTMKYE